MIGRRGHKCHLSVMFHLCDDLRASTLISSIIHLPMSLMMVVMMIKTIPKQQWWAKPRLAENVNCSSSISSASSSPHFARSSISIEKVYWYTSMWRVALIKRRHHLSSCSLSDDKCSTQTQAFFYKLLCNIKFWYSLRQLWNNSSLSFYFCRAIRYQIRRHFIYFRFRFFC